MAIVAVELEQRPRPSCPRVPAARPVDLEAAGPPRWSPPTGTSFISLRTSSPAFATRSQSAQSPGAKPAPSGTGFSTPFRNLRFSMTSATSSSLTGVNGPLDRDSLVFGQLERRLDLDPERELQVAGRIRAGLEESRSRAGTRARARGPSTAFSTALPTSSLATSSLSCGPNFFSMSDAGDLALRNPGSETWPRTPSKAFSSSASTSLAGTTTASSFAAASQIRDRNVHGLRNLTTGSAFQHVGVDRVVAHDHEVEAGGPVELAVAQVRSREVRPRDVAAA